MSGSEETVGTTRVGLLTTIWLFTSIALGLFGFRIAIRQTIQHKLYWDDFFAAMATTLLLVTAILYTISIPLTYEQIALQSDPDASSERQYELAFRLQRLLIPLQALFWTILWSVKFSFLFLYKLILCQSQAMCRTWWVCACFMLLTYGVMLIAVFGQCGAGGDIYDLAQCGEPANLAFNRRMIWVEFVFVVLTDLIVIILPLPVLWRLQMPTTQKIALTPVFCLALICIAFDTLRTVEQWTGNLTQGLLWTSLETEMSVIACLLPTFRFIISADDKAKLYRRRLLSIITLRSFDGPRAAKS